MQIGTSPGIHPHRPQRCRSDRAPQQRNDQQQPADAPPYQDQRRDGADRGWIRRYAEGLRGRPRTSRERSQQRVSDHANREQRRYQPESASVRRRERDSARENTETDEKQRLEREVRREPRRHPVDLGIALIKKGPADPHPAHRQQARDKAITVPVFADQQCDDRKPDRRARDLRGPDRKIVELEKAVVGPWREQQKTGEPIRPPFGHQPRSTAAIMRWRIAASGMRPDAEFTFSRT